MPLTGSIRKYIVFYLRPDDFKPFEKVRGQITVEPVAPENIPELTRHFPAGKVPVFHEKLRLGHRGVLARYRSEVVGYMWRRDYDSTNTVKADGYIPLRGKFSHFHFARVSKEMRGRGIQLLMFTQLIRDTYAQGIKRIYTDGEQDNIVSMRGTMKVGFHEIFRLVVFEVFGRKVPIQYLGDNCYNGPDSIKKIVLGKLRWIFSSAKQFL